MSVNTPDLLFSRDVVSALSQRHQEPDWMRQFRMQALEAASDLPLPKVEKTRIRFWNFTNFTPYKDEQVVQNLSQLPASMRSFFDDTEGGRNLVLQHNSSVVYTELMSELKDKGIIFTDLHSAVREHGDLVRKYFMNGEAATFNEHKLSALHGALWSGGVFLYVPKNTELTVPIQSLLWADHSGAGLLPHVLIVVEDNSRLTYVDSYVADEGISDVVHNGMTEIFVGANAQVQYATLHHYGDGVLDVTNRYAVLDRDARIDWTLGELNNGNTLSYNKSVLKGHGSAAYVKSIAVGSGKQQNNLTSHVQHIGKHTDSDLLARSVMKDAAQSILNSVTKIEKGAAKANGEQTGRVLMLSEQSRGDANPILLIDEYDVTAGHAASVGQIDPMQIYYLMSRGLSKTDAERLIIYGFLNPLLAEIPIKDVVEQLERVIERKLR